MKRKGIAAGGSWIVDKTIVIDDYPHQDGLCNILETSYSNGGAPYNVLKAISKLGNDIPLTGIGLLGDDKDGQYILDDCREHGINTQGIVSESLQNSSYTLVMTSKKTGRRTFFHHRGTNSNLKIGHFNVDEIKCKILHLGYLLLLDNLDGFERSGRTRASILLENVRSLGIKTSVDLVSEINNRFQKIVPSSLPHIDYLFVNEYEACQIAFGRCENSQKKDIEHLVTTGKRIIDMGVNEFVIIHFPKGTIAVDKNGKVWKQGSVQLPKNLIKGSSGAGDAFAAGVLYGFHENFIVQDALKLGVCVAAGALRDFSSSNGIGNIKEMWGLGNRFGYYQT
ncbi:MAG: carbohydrate kinase family protein [Bacteroidota bacterium]